MNVSRHGGRGDRNNQGLPQLSPSQSLVYCSLAKYEEQEMFREEERGGLSGWLPVCS